MDIRKFLKQKGENKIISAQGYLKQRNKLNTEVFTDLKDYYFCLFYEDPKGIKTWNGYIVLTVGESKAEITNSCKNRLKYGTIGNNYTEGSAGAMISGRTRLVTRTVVPLEHEFSRWICMNLHVLAVGKTSMWTLARERR